MNLYFSKKSPPIKDPHSAQFVDVQVLKVPKIKEILNRKKTVKAQTSRNLPYRLESEETSKSVFKPSYLQVSIKEETVEETQEIVQKRTEISQLIREKEDEQLKLSRNRIKLKKLNSKISLKLKTVDCEETPFKQKTLNLPISSFLKPKTKIKLLRITKAEEVLHREKKRTTKEVSTLIFKKSIKLIQKVVQPAGSSFKFSSNQSFRAPDRCHNYRKRNEKARTDLHHRNPQ